MCYHWLGLALPIVDFVNHIQSLTLGIGMEKQKIITLKKTKAEIFWDPSKAVKRLIDDYEKSIHFLRENFDKFLQNGY